MCIMDGIILTAKCAGSLKFHIKTFGGFGFQIFEGLSVEFGRIFYAFEANLT